MSACQLKWNLLLQIKRTWSLIVYKTLQWTLGKWVRSSEGRHEKFSRNNRSKLKPLLASNLRQPINFGYMEKWVEIMESFGWLSKWMIMCTAVIMGNTVTPAYLGLSSPKSNPSPGEAKTDKRREKLFAKELHSTTSLLWYSRCTYTNESAFICREKLRDHVHIPPAPTAI